MPAEGPTLTPAQGIDLLNRQVEKGKLFKAGQISKDSLETWINTTHACIEKAFGIGHRNVDDFLQRGEETILPAWRPQQWQQYYWRVLRAKMAALTGYIEELQIDRDIQSPVRSGDELPARPEVSSKIFIVHGHDGELKHATARLVTQLGLEPVILHEQPNRGQTIIEKLSSHASVLYP